MDIKLSKISITTFGIYWDSWDFLGFGPEFVIPSPIPKFWKIDPNPNPKNLGLGLRSIFQNFGIGLGITNSGQNPKKSQESQRSSLKFKIILYPWIINNFFRIIV